MIPSGWWGGAVRPPFNLSLKQLKETMFGASRFATVLAVQLVSDDSGQDLIEYALLTAIVGISGVLILSALSMTMGTAYSSWNSAGQNAWEPGPPQ